jgi:ubiquinone/menaquinone biosynthesis C-methylase UbiE
MSWVEELFDGPYDSEYAGVLANTERAAREAEFIIRELDLKETDRVLDLACGHGRHALLAAGHVAEVVAYDRTKRFIEYGQRWATDRGVTNVQFIIGDMRELSFDAEFDAVYNYFTSWGYYDDETNFDILKRIRHALKPGGQFLLEFIARDVLMRGFKDRDWYELDDGTVVLIEHSFNFETGRQHSQRTYRKGSETKMVEIDLRIPAPEELLCLFREAGFTRTRLVQAPDGSKVTLNTRRIAVIGSRLNP